MKTVTLSPHVSAAVSDLRTAAAQLRAAPGTLTDPCADICEALATLWAQGWAPSELSPRDRAILRMAKAALDYYSSERRSKTAAVGETSPADTPTKGNQHHA